MVRMKEFFQKNRVEWGLFFAFFLFLFLLTRVSQSPLIYPDEAGYIGWARKILFGTSDGLRYLPGYSLLLSPLFLITNEIRKLYPLITAFNAMLGACIPVVVYRLVRLFAQEKTRVAVLVTTAVCLYPSIALYANLAMCEVLLTLLFLLLLLAVASIEKNVSSIKGWIFALLLSGMIALTHTRGFVILPVLLLVLSLPVKRGASPRVKRIYFVSLGVLAAFFVTGVCYFMFYTASPNTVHLREQLVHIFSWDGIRNLLTTLVSQFSYLILSTYGFVVIGVWYALTYLKKVGEGRVTVMFLLLSFLAGILLSALFLSHHEKPDHILYGRYNEYILPGILLFGILGFQNLRIPKWLLTVPVLFVAVTGWMYAGELTGIDKNLSHTWGIYLYKLFFFNFEYWSVVLLFAILAGLLYLLRRRCKKIALGLLCCLFLFSVCYTEYDYFLKGASPRHETPALTEFLGNEELTVRAEALSGNSMGYPWEYYNYMVYNPSLKISQREGNLLLSQALVDGMSMLGMEKGGPVYLYKTADRDNDNTLNVSNQTLPGRYPAVLDTYQSRICVQPDESGNLKVQLTNLGSPWPCYDAVRDIRSAVRLAVRVFDSSHTIVWEQRYDIPKTMYAGESADFIVSLSIPDGEYLVSLEAVQEFNTWFSQKGDEGQLALWATVKDGTISVKSQEQGYLLTPEQYLFQTVRPDFLREAEDIPNTTYAGNLDGFYRYWTEQGGAVIRNISCPVLPQNSYLALTTKGEREIDGHEVKVSVNGTRLSFSHSKGNTYYFILDSMDEVNVIAIDAPLMYPAQESGIPRIFTFLRTDSNCKPISYFVRGMRKLFGINLDWRGFGIDLDHLKIV